MKTKTLCQDCLRVAEVSLADYIAADYGKGICKCGGEVCHCNSCRYDITSLVEWDWNKPYPYFKKPIYAWTPEEGTVIDRACDPG